MGIVDGNIDMGFAGPRRHPAGDRHNKRRHPNIERVVFGHAGRNETQAKIGSLIIVGWLAAGEDGATEWGAAAIGAVISAITAYFVIAGLMRLLRAGSFRPFIVYCAVVGVGVVIARAVGA